MDTIIDLTNEDYQGDMLDCGSENIEEEEQRSLESDDGQDLQDFIVYDDVTHIPHVSHPILVSNEVYENHILSDEYHEKKEDAVLTVKPEVSVIGKRKSSYCMIRKDLRKANGKVFDMRVLELGIKTKYHGYITKFIPRDTCHPTSGWHFHVMGEWHKCNLPDAVMATSCERQARKEISMFNAKLRNRCPCSTCT
jgi:hypothetical protein